MARFSPSRLTLARHRRRLTQVQLAQLVGVSDRSIRAFEGGDDPAIADETIDRLAQVLGFPRAFFCAAELEPITEGTASFRALSKRTAAQRNAVLAAGTLAMDLTERLETRYRLPPADLPDLREDSPEAAAATLRTRWGLGERPIKNMLHLLEAHGVRVFSLVDDCREIDAFSLWRGGRPYVFVNTSKSAERGRFDLAHETAHLVLHQHGAPQGREAETQADAFGSAFLMPRASVLAHAPRVPSIPVLIQLKRRWGVSLAAMAYRLHALGVLSDWQYRTICIQMAELGYRTREPNTIPRETSQLLRKLFALMRDDGTTMADLAREAALPVSEVDGLVRGLALVSVEGGEAPAAAHARPRLRLV